MSKETFEPLAPMESDPEMRAQYDFTKAVRGKHRGRFADGYVVRVEGADGAR